jgi:methyltransferase
VTPLIVLLVVYACLVVEARRAARNEAALRVRGGLEPRGDVYKMMRVAYPGAFAAMCAEGVWRGGPAESTVIAGAVVFAAAKGLKWWAIRSLGPFWTFRVIVVPRSRLVDSGPYRWLRHPNYVGVIGEFVGVGLLTGGWVALAATLVIWTGLLHKRISIETTSLDRRLN